MDTFTSTFINTWKAWDSRPTDQDRTNKMVDACIELAELLGVTHMEVRRSLAEFRRDRFSYKESLELTIRRL